MASPEVSTLVPSNRAVRSSVWNWFFIGAIGLFTFAPVVFVLVKSFDVSGIGEDFDFGLGGWQRALGGTGGLSAIVTTRG